MADKKHAHEKHALVPGGPAHEVMGVACQLKDVQGKGSVSVLRFPQTHLTASFPSCSS